MRAVFAILSLVVFLSSQGLAHACLDSCSHHQKKEVSKESEHECCAKMSSSEDEEKTHGCELHHCLKSTYKEIPTLTLENRWGTTDLSGPAAVAYISLDGSHSGDPPVIENRDIWRQPPKVPLYIAYQKLLLP